MSDDLLVFADSDQKNEEKIQNTPWKIIIADDEPEIHRVTKLALEDVSFKGKEIEFISVYSGKETIECIKKNMDTAVILLDVVMEKDDSGLEVVQYIRQKIKNNLVRIVLRTGQPGYAPERMVITEYDINDYKEKTELTDQKLYTSVISALRSYRDLKALDKNKRGLKQVVKASSSLFLPTALNQFVEGVIMQLTSLLYLDEGALCKYISTLIAFDKNGLIILGGTGQYCNCANKRVKDVVPDDVYDKLKKALAEKRTFYFDYEYVGYFAAEGDSEYLLYMKGLHKLSEADKELLDLFSLNIGAAFMNISRVINRGRVDKELNKLKKEADFQKTMNAELKRVIEEMKKELEIYRKKIKL